MRGTIWQQRWLMITITASKARERLCKFLDIAVTSHNPIRITGRQSNGILIGEEDWNAIQETLYLLSVPGMRESIRRGLETPLKKASRSPHYE